MVHNAARSLVKQCRCDIPANEDLKMVATEYGHSIFVDSLEKTTSAADIVSSAQELIVNTILGSAEMTKKHKLLRRVKSSSTFTETSDGFNLANSSAFKSSNTEFYKQWWNLFHYNDVMGVVMNTATSSADAYDYFNEKWSSDVISESALRLKTALSYLSKEADRLSD